MFTRQQTQEMQRILDQGNREALDAYINANHINVNDMDVEHNTLLHMAVSRKKMNIVKYLLEEKNVKVDPVNKQEKTPAHIAVEDKQDELFLYLIDQGANRKKIFDAANGVNVLGDPWKHQPGKNFPFVPSYFQISQRAEELNGQQLADCHVAVRRHNKQLNKNEEDIRIEKERNDRQNEKLSEHDQKMRRHEGEIEVERGRNDIQDEQLRNHHQLLESRKAEIEIEKGKNVTQAEQLRNHHQLLETLEVEIRIERERNVAQNQKLDEYKQLLEEHKREIDEIKEILAELSKQIPPPKNGSRWNFFGGSGSEQNNGKRKEPDKDNNTGLPPIYSSKLSKQ